MSPPGESGNESLVSRWRLPAACVAALLVGLALAALLPAPARALDTSTRTAAEIRQRWSVLKPTYDGSPYLVRPHTSSPYSTGTLAPRFLEDGLNSLNYIRFLAGLPDDVTLDEAMNDSAQHGAVLLAASEFSHSPPQPNDMGDGFYQAGLDATSSSNIGWGYGSLAQFNFDCAGDSDSGNIKWLGHRRWLLDPPLLKTGMGYADTRCDTLVFDWSRVDPVDYDTVKWPCEGLFPTQMFAASTAWSISLNPQTYTWTAGDQTVTLRRVGDGRTWTFTSADTDTSGKYFRFDTSGYGEGPCAIFRPDPASVGEYRAGDVFEVTLSGGIFLSDGVTPATISYATEFMSQLLPLATVTTPHTPATPRRGRAFTVWGYLKPHHDVGTFPVKLYFRHRESGRWVLRKTVQALASDYSTYTKYTAAVRLSRRGRWRVRAYHADADHRATYSAWRYLTVK